MKNLKKIVYGTVVAMVIGSSVAIADDANIGVGVSIGDTNSQIRMPIELDNSLRLEPYFGFSYKNPDDAASTTNWQIGAALHKEKEFKEAISGYYGGYLGFERNEIDNSSQNVFILGPVAGIEYALEKNFTIGGEVRLNIGFGDETQVETQTAVLLRYYF